MSASELLELYILLSRPGQTSVQVHRPEQIRPDREGCWCGYRNRALTLAIFATAICRFDDFSLQCTVEAERETRVKVCDE